MATVAEMLGVAWKHLQAGSWSQAEQLYRQVLQAEPAHADAWFFLGAACQSQRKLQEAKMHYRRVIELRPEQASAYYNLALALEQEGKLEEAVGSYREALRLEPENLSALNNLGNILTTQRKLAEAIACYRQVLRLKPDFAEVHANLGNALADQDRLAEAVDSYRQALRLRPDYAEAHYNLGVLFAKRGSLDEAIACYRQALGLKPDYAEAQVNLGNALRLTGQLDEALASFERALRVKPDFASGRWNRSVVLLARGEFEQGWPEYEWRWAQHSFALRHFAQPLWDGSDLGGRTILLYAEQGLGDTLHFIRYVPLAKQRGGSVIVECQAPLLRLLAGFPGIDCLLAQGSPLPAFDVRAPLLSLPGIFHTSFGSIPAPVPYLRADADLVKHWRRELKKGLGARDEGRESGMAFSSLAPRPSPLAPFLVGIAWQGNPTNPGDRHRSIPLVHFARLAQVPGVQLISLQKGPGSDQLHGLAGRFPVLDLDNRLDEASGAFMDTTAVMMNLDLVISSDTVVPHLAGALGVPVWVAVSLAPDWRWLLDREDSPWYPTMRLFRQNRYGDWEGVFGRIAEDLRAVVGCQRTNY